MQTLLSCVPAHHVAGETAGQQPTCLLIACTMFQDGTPRSD